MTIFIINAIRRISAKGIMQSPAEQKIPVSNIRRLVGAVMWTLSIQYFIAQILVASEWTTHPYSWTLNTISDLGNTSCVVFGGRDVCSPDHLLMNASFIMLGCTMAAGSLLLQGTFQRSKLKAAGFLLMAAAGLGTILVGAFPENTGSSLHAYGASLPFLFGNIGMIILGMNLPKLHPAMRAYSIISGLVALVALGFFITKNYGVVSIGGMERIVAYPQTVWLIVFGIYLLYSRTRHT